MHSLELISERNETVLEGLIFVCVSTIKTPIIEGYIYIYIYSAVRAGTRFLERSTSSRPFADTHTKEGGTALLLANLNAERQ